MGTSAADALALALLQLDLRLRAAVERLRAELAHRADDPFRGLYISDEDVDALLSQTAAREVDARLPGAPARAILPRLARLAEVFGLTPFEQEVILVCLAPELDLRYERLYAYLQDDVSRRRPTVDLILRLLEPPGDQLVDARRTLGPAGPLFTAGLLILADEGAERWPLLTRPVRLDERIVEYLLGCDRLDGRLSAFVRLIEPAAAEADLLLPPDLQASLARLLRTDTRQPGPVVYLHGPSGAARRGAVRTACRSTGQSLLLVDLASALAAGKAVAVLPLVIREAILQDAVLALDGFDRLLSDEPEMMPIRAALRAALARRIGVTFLIGETRWEPAGWLPTTESIRVELPSLPPTARRHLWQRHLGGRLPDEEVTDLAARFRLDDEAIRAVALTARLHAAWRGETEVGEEDVRAAAREIAAPPLEGLARRVEPRYDWDDLVLPTDGLAQLREICARARYQATVLERWGFGHKHARRAGLTALFAGQPGTGKTMAAEIVAGALGLELYRIDLAAVVSKYIGETEKNLERIFRAADQGDAVLLFDEADALFGKRSEVRDAHDRYANVEIAYLLQRLETYDGLAILTTNLRGNLDEAFVRRLDFVLEFPMPEEAERLAIWRRAIPPETPLADDVDLAFLARKFRLAGGHIRNVALGAAFLAAADHQPITMKHLVRATRREYQKIGKLVGAGDFEQYFPLLKGP